VNTENTFTEAQVARLAQFLRAPQRPEGTMTYCELAGFLYAVSCAPETIRPSEWLPLVFNEGEAGFETPDEAQEILPAILLLYNEVNRVVAEFCPELPPGCAILPDPMANLDPEAPLSRWARGFGGGYDWLQETWGRAPKELDEVLGVDMMVLSFFASRRLAERYLIEWKAKATLEELAATVVDAFPEAVSSFARIGRTLFKAGLESQHQAREPVRRVKIGRNEPCPCGSGKKYKVCCGG
jgi:uncharacterized protein